MKILLVAGGWSTERDISLAGAENIAAALRKNGHEVTPFDFRDDFDRFLSVAEGHDFAFLNLHGAPGEDGLPQAMLETIGCPYQGSGAAGSFLALHKAAAKEIFRRNDLPTAQWRFLTSPPPADWLPGLRFPLFVKSNNGGSSLHLGRVCDMGQLNMTLGEIFAARECALLEPEIKGREITCAVLGDKALPPILIEPVVGDFFDFNSKYVQGGAREICPAPISQEETATVQRLALRAHKALGLQGYSRADFIMNQSGEFILLEVNTLPGMTSTSLLPQAAAQAGYDFPALLEKLIELGLEDHGCGRSKTGMRL